MHMQFPVPQLLNTETSSLGVLGLSFAAIGTSRKSMAGLELDEIG